jgi:PTH2 family peptidyl-tRNA hydrolase
MYKQIIILRKDLGLSVGKASAQASHASMAFLTAMIQENVIGEVLQGADRNQRFMSLKSVYRVGCFDIDKDLYEQWIGGSFTKCVLKAKNKNHLLKAKKMAEELGMVEGKDFFCIYDACRTELEPEEYGEDGIGRTLTCIGFKPMDNEVIDKIGKKYQLYS